ncbi:MAG TPA: hypothetical protein VG013_14260, partial [Gemmataceae bacterium]|nr:hypothetical protein [Gemmataceae bacterium]
GWSNLPNGSTEAYLYDGTTMNDLGTLPGAASSIAVGINNAGQVVGYSYPAGSGSDFFHAFLSDGSTMTDLNDLIPSDSGWVLRFAEAINDAGQIVGYGANPDGLSHAFLLTPDGSRPQVASLPIASPTSGVPIAPTPLEAPLFVKVRQTDPVPEALTGPTQRTTAREGLLPASADGHVRDLVLAEGQPFAGWSDLLGNGRFSAGSWDPDSVVSTLPWGHVMA